WFARIEKVGGAATGFDGSDCGLFDRRRRVTQGKAVAEHERRGKNLRDGIRQILAGDVWRRAARRFVKAKRVSPARFSETRAGQHAERAAQRGGFVAENVAEHVFAKQHVELRWAQHKL